MAFLMLAPGSSLDSSEEKTSSGTKNQAPLRAKVFFSKTGNALSEVPKVTCKKHQMKHQMFEEFLMN